MQSTKVIEGERRIRRASIGIAVGVVAVALLVTLVIVQPGMPDRIILLTGPEGSAYHALGRRYAEDVRSRGLEAEVIVTGGAIDNLRRLAAGDEQAVAFAPATLDGDDDPGHDLTHLIALGSVGYEPAWLFHRRRVNITRISDLAGLTVATGTDESTSGHIARELMELNDLTDRVELRTLPGDLANSVVDAFAAETIDAALVTGDADSPVVRMLLDDDDIRLAAFDRAEAYAARTTGLTTLVAPEGVFDLSRNVPDADMTLLSTTTCLVAHEHLNAAVAPMVLIAAGRVRAKTTTFTNAVSFPSPELTSLPLDESARRYFSQGRTGLTRFLPYKAARFVRHIGLVVVPVLTTIGVVIKLASTGLRLWGNVHLVGLFKQLEAVEKSHAAGGDRSDLLADLQCIDDASAKLFVPRSAAHDYVDFRQCLHDMRERVSSSQG